MRIPSGNIWTQTNKGDRFGILHDTENVTLFVDGKVKLSKKSFNRYNSVDDANLGDILGIAYYGTQYLALTRGNMFAFDLGGSSVSEITMSIDIDYNSDLLVCYNRAYITTNDNLDYYDGALTQNRYALTSGMPHPMAVFDSLPTYKLAIGNGNTVVTLSSAHAANPTVLTIPQQYLVVSLAYNNGYLYVGAKDSNGEGRIFAWNGSGTNAQYEIPIGASQVYSMVPYMGSIAFLTNRGRLCAVSGTSYTELASFPVFNSQYDIWDNVGYLTNPNKVLNRGMAVVNDSIYILIDGTVDSGLIPEMKHGLWVYNPKNGLSHTSNASSDRSVVETPSALTDNTLTLSTHYLKDGDLVVVRAIGSLTGITTGTKYYAKVISSTQIKLALTHKALLDGNYVAIGGAVTGSNISYVPNTDYSQTVNAFAGAICAINPEEPFFTGWETPVIWGNRIQKPDGTNFYGLYGLTQAWNIGRFTTQRIYTDNIVQSWNTLYGFFSGVLLDNEKIIIKYKDSNTKAKPTKMIKGVWLNETTINSIGNDDEDEWRDIEDGDEIMIVDGYGRGYSAHVIGKDLTSNTKSIELDESIGTANGDVYFFCDSFKKVTTITNNRDFTNVLSAKLPSVKSPWIQIRVEMRGFEIEFDMLELLNQMQSAGN